MRRACNWGSSLCKLDRLDEAEIELREAIAADPSFAHAHHNLAVVLKETGRISEAVRTAKRAIRLAPQDPFYYENLAAIRKFTPRCRYLKALEQLAQDCASLSIDDQIALHLALAKAYEDIGKPDVGFEHMLKGNQLKRRQIAYDEDVVLARMKRTRELFNADLFALVTAQATPRQFRSSSSGCRARERHWSSKSFRAIPAFLAPAKSIGSIRPPVLLPKQFPVRSHSWIR